MYRPPRRHVLDQRHTQPGFWFFVTIFIVIGGWWVTRTDSPTPTTPSMDVPNTDPPSNQTIILGIADGIQLQHHTATQGAGVAPPAPCDQACAAQFHIEIVDRGSPSVGMMPGFWDTYGPYPYWDIQVRLTTLTGRRKSMTVRFWDTGSGKEWEVGEPLMAPGTHLRVDSQGKRLSFGFE